MGLSDAHKGYEYQDLFSVFHIVKMLLSYDNAIFKIDQKETANDKFDDLTIITDNLIMKRQIKYSDSKVLEKADLSSEKYDLALDTLFKSWKELPKDKDIDIRICLAWEFLEDSQELDFLTELEIKNYYNSDEVKVLKINLDSIWPSGGNPISSWRRLRDKTSDINRVEFEQFIEDLTIEVNLPKSSADFANPGLLESLVIKNLRLFGVGKYPNDKKSIVDVAMHLMHIIKGARARGQTLELSKVIFDIGLMKSYGNIEQEFKIDRNINVLTKTKYHEFKEFLFANNKICLLGEPGSGKSWFIQNFIEFLEEHNINVVKHYCYTGIDDLYEKERITINIFIANLINDIMKSFPYLEVYKTSKYGVDFEELQLLINHIQEDVVLIVDGLDHIGRIYSFHKEVMKKIDTEIVEIISRLEFPSNVKIVLVSQPVTEVLQLCEKNFNEYTVNNWSIEEVKVFIRNNALSDIMIDYNCKLSDLLLEKSSGNPLYLTYLVNELSKYSHVMITRDLVESFPLYNNNLENYYSYLMSKLSESQKVPQILAGSPFPLTEHELKEITYLGAYVVESIEVIRSILSYNSCSGGYVIYHESFRRYILELLEKNEVSVERVIYSDLIDWLKKKGFYKDRKSYLNLIVLLFEAKRYNEILEYCNKEFVIDSIYYGNNIFSLKSNFEILMKTACKVKDYGAVIVCTELSNMIYSLEYSFEENSKYYYWGLGLINGFENLKSTLTYDGKTALSYNEGLKICYLCSQNNVIPDWDKYIELLIEVKKAGSGGYKSYNDKLEEYKYFICACLDTGKNMKDKIEKISGAYEYDYRRVVIVEYYRRGLIEELRELISQIHDQENWINSISEFLCEKKVDEQYIEVAFDKLRQSDSYSEETLKALNYYFYNIDWIISNHSDKISKFISSIENKNWYYNWLIFIYKINSVINTCESEEINDGKLIEAYSWLTKDMDCFKGEPRTCDLYKYESIIFESIKRPLKYVTNESTWCEVFRIIEEMSSGTMTSLMGSIGGPLPTDKLFDLFLDIANESNSEVISNIFKNRMESEDKHRFYSYLADYSLKYTIVLAKSGRMNEAKTEFRRGVEYLLSYSFRKDRTLSRLIDSVESICKIDKDVGLHCILRLKPLADAVVHHTDGRSTKTYQREWFEVLARHNIDIALTHISNELMIYDNYWVLEESFDYLLQVMNSEIDPVIENVLFKTRPNNVDLDFIKSYLNNIRVLLNNEELHIAKQSMRELLNRFPSGIYSECYDKIRELCELLDLSVKVQIKSETYSSRNYSNNAERKIKYEKRIRNNSFDVMSTDEVLEYIVTYGIKESEVQSFYYYMQSIKELTFESRMFISNLIRHIYERSDGDENRKRLLKIIDNLSIDSTIMAYIYVMMYMNHKDGWNRRLTQIEYFVKAVEFNKEVAEQNFFDYFYNNFYSVDYSLSVGDKIINALTKIEFDGELIIRYWESLFDIINFRLSGQYHYNWQEIIDTSTDFTSVEKLIFLLLTRLKYGEANRYKWIISGIDKMFENPRYRTCFIKPFKYYLKKCEKFIDYSLIILLWLILKWFSNEDLVQSDLINDILKIYPTNNGVIDYLIRKITGKKKQRIYKKYTQTYNFKDERINCFTKMLKQTDNIVSMLEKRGIDIRNIVQNYVKELFDPNTRERLKDILYNREYNILVQNVYFYDIFMKYISNEVESFINQYAGIPFVDDIEEELYEILIDNLDYVIAITNSITPRPSDIEFPSNVENSIISVESEEWVRIAYYERWYSKRERYKDSYGENMDATIVISGLGFAGNEDIVPFLRLRSEYRIFDENYEQGLSNIPLIITSDIKIDEDMYLTFRSYEYLGIRGDILNALGIKIMDKGDGIIGIDSAGDIVLKYSRWEVCFNDIDSGSYRVPYLIGSELKVKDSVYNQICKFYCSAPKRYTIKLS
ncbi:ATP-binding protein [Clostridium paraputrificum]|uniref:ATP-binding protein n=1 Tax=Clostridium paraputrificum TaxID=29363 RepID=UPI00232F6CED|nr:ATP-binding protein [Clostridium paraputrificum]MDB2072189.1 ATP-binding protein [Clostridium paraputrificum]MDB2082622.1 ATP-binding protein [Clostridium paraputrificum]